MEANNARPIFPWYKERLQTKYLKAPANKISSVGMCCRFATVSLDDFNDCPSVLSGDRGGVSPVIFHDAPKHNSTKSGQKPRKCISKEHACFSKQMIQKQIRREHVASVEKELKQHPLAMFAHYKDHMTPELFDEVVSILDPDMSVNSAYALPTSTDDHAEEETEENYTEPTMMTRNPYILQMKRDGIKKGRTVKGNQRSTHKDMKVAAKPFSRRFAFPDKESNVSESAILGLQDTSSPSFPIEVEDAKKFSGQELNPVTATNRQDSFQSLSGN